MADAHCMKRCLNHAKDLQSCLERCRTVCGDGGAFGIKDAVEEGAKYFKVMEEKAKFVAKMEEINATKWRVPVKAGHAAEAFHRFTYNVDAIKNDIPTRAEYTPYGSPKDLTLGKEDVQIKYGQPNYLKKLNQPKYDGMQKIVPKGSADPSKGWKDHIEVDGAKSKPLSNKGAKELVNNSKSISKAIPTESRLMSAAKVGGEAAFVGGIISAASSGTVMALKGGDGEKVVKSMAKGGAEGALTSGLSAATANAVVTSTGDQIAGAISGGVVSNLVSTGFNVTRCTKRYEDKGEIANCKQSEMIKGGTSTLYAALATGMCGPLCGAAAGSAVRGLWDFLKYLDI